MLLWHLAYWQWRLLAHSSLTPPPIRYNMSPRQHCIHTQLKTRLGRELLTWPGYRGQLRHSHYRQRFFYLLFLLASIKPTLHANGKACWLLHCCFFSCNWDGLFKGVKLRPQHVTQLQSMHLDCMDYVEIESFRGLRVVELDVILA